MLWVSLEILLSLELHYFTAFAKETSRIRRILPDTPIRRTPSTYMIFRPQSIARKKKLFNFSVLNPVLPKY